MPPATRPPSKSSATKRFNPPAEPPICHAASPRSTDAPRPAPDIALPTLPRGPPRKTERPHHHLPEPPITHHVPDTEPTRAECRSKPGRPRTHPIPPTRPRTAKPKLERPTDDDRT